MIEHLISILEVSNKCSVVLEQCRQNYETELNALASSLFRLNELIILLFEQYHNRATHQHILTLGQDLFSIQICVKSIYTILCQFLEEVPNYFGKFEPQVYFHNIMLKQRNLDYNVEKMKLKIGDVNDGNSMSPSTKHVCKGYSLNAWEFWKGHFEDDEKVLWSEFQNAFSNSFGKQPESTMVKLENYLWELQYNEIKAKASTVLKSRLENTANGDQFGSTTENARIKFTIPVASVETKKLSVAMESLSVEVSPTDREMKSTILASNEKTNKLSEVMESSNKRVNKSEAIQYNATETNISSVTKTAAAPETSMNDTNSTTETRKNDWWIQLKTIEQFCGGTDLYDSFQQNFRSSTTLYAINAVGLISKHTKRTSVEEEETEVLPQFLRFLAEDGVIDDMDEIEQENGTLDVPLKTIDALFGVAIVHISCGGKHAAAVSDIGRLYTWGDGKYGSLGHGSEDHVEEPKLVQSLSNHDIVQVDCGYSHTACVSKEGKLFTWGSATHGRLGHNSTAPDEYYPRMVEKLWENNILVKQVSSGSVHTCCLSVSGNVYSFGKHEYTGQGLLADVLVPQEIDSLREQEICQISVGVGYHSVALTADGQIYTWGHNRVGQLGIPSADMQLYNGAPLVTIPQHVERFTDHNIVEVAAGWGHTAVRTSKYEVWVCGRNCKGELGVGPGIEHRINNRNHPYLDHFTRIDSLLGKKIVKVSCGREKTVMVTECGEIYTCGSTNKNRSSKAGTGIETPTYLNAPEFESRKVLHVACGSNTTLILAGLFYVPSLVDICLSTLFYNGFDLLEYDKATFPVGLFEIIQDAFKSKRRIGKTLE